MVNENVLESDFEPLCDGTTRRRSLADLRLLDSDVFRIAWRESTLSYRKALKTARSDYFSSLLEQNKHNPRYLFNSVAKLTKNKASTGVDISQQHSSNDFMNNFTSKIDTIRDQIVTMQPSAILSHQIVYYRSPEEQFHSFSTIGEEELYKLVKSSKPGVIKLDPGGPVSCRV